jgi:hypothetical protein
MLETTKERTQSTLRAPTRDVFVALSKERDEQRRRRAFVWTGATSGTAAAIALASAVVGGALASPALAAAVAVGAVAGAALGLIEAAASRQLARRTEHELEYQWRVLTAALGEAQNRAVAKADDFTGSNPNESRDSGN